MTKQDLLLLLLYVKRYSKSKAILNRIEPFIQQLME